MRIEVWADIVCPWCGIAEERMNRALERFGHDDEIEVVHRAYRLSPDLPEDHGVPLVAELTDGRGLSDDDARAAYRRIEEIAAADGITPYHVGDGLTGNTMRILQLLAFATSRGVGREAWNAAFRAHFRQRRDIWNLEALADFADDLGLNGDEALYALHTGRFAQEVEDDQAEAVALGARGVPFVVIDRRIGISGVQTVDRLVEVLEKARSAAGEAEAVDA